MIDIVIDFETFYSKEYTLRDLTTVEYLLDPRFEVIGFAISVNGSVPAWYSGTKLQLAAQLTNYDWANARVICHNAVFDGGILEWYFGINPAKYFCTMMGSRPYVAPYTGSMSLDAVASFLEVGAKGKEVQNHMGRQRDDFSSYQLAMYGAYCCNDVDLTGKIAARLLGWLPDDEAYLIHLTLLKFLRPSFVLSDVEIAEGRDGSIGSRAELKAKLDALAVTEQQLRSRPSLSKLLRDRGVDPPMKVSKASVKGGGLIKMTEAFAKEDEEFLALLVHPNEEVRTIVEGKLEFGSTQEVSRLERFQKIYDMDLGGERLLPVPLLYYAAHPGRFGGSDSINLQNLPRPDPTKKKPWKDALRRSMKAPPGFVVMSADYSAIEARIVATLACQWDLVAAFAAGRDVYAEFASKIYGRPIDKKNDPLERFVGKTCILALGYGMGHWKFLNRMALAGVPMDEETADRIVKLYRRTYPRIKEYWGEIENMLKHSTTPAAMYKFGPFLFAHERIILPNSMSIIYPGLSLSIQDGQLQFESRRKGKATINRLWGGLITENVVQALARIIATRAEIRISRAGMPCAHQAHDELIWVVREDWVSRVIKAVESAMRDPVQWLPRLPIAVEIGYGPSYGEAK